MPQKALQLTRIDIPSDELISLEDCKKFVEDYSLSDDRVLSLRNNLIGIVNSVLNAYLETFE